MKWYEQIKGIQNSSFFLNIQGLWVDTEGCEGSEELVVVGISHESWMDFSAEYGHFWVPVFVSCWFKCLFPTDTPFPKKYKQVPIWYVSEWWTPILGWLNTKKDRHRKTEYLVALLLPRFWAIPMLIPLWLTGVKGVLQDALSMHPSYVCLWQLWKLQVERFFHNFNHAAGTRTGRQFDRLKMF